MIHRALLAIWLPLAAADEIPLAVGPPSSKLIRAVHFAVNCEFYRAGLYYGTLPASDPRSKADAFAEALARSDVRALRFPGGNAGYYYLPESRRLTMQLAHAMGSWAFRENNPPSDCFVKLENFVAFCRERGLQIIYQLPMLFYLDRDTPRAVIRSKFSDRARNYDRDRLAEGAAYAAGLVRRLQALRAPVAAWELGNEEFAHCDAKDYARACAAYAAAIRRVDPSTPIIAVGMGKGWLSAVAAGLRQAGALKFITSFNAHYPFGAWPGPSRPELRGDPGEFVKGDLRMERWLQAAQKGRAALGLERIPISVTETTVMRFKNWHPRQIVATHAHALVYAWNWMSLLEWPTCDAAVFHDLETPYFGILRYDAGFDEEKREFVWLACAKSGRRLKRFPRQYVCSPTGAVNRLLSQLVGLRVRPVKGWKAAPGLRAIAAGTPGGRAAMVIVNRSPKPALIRIRGLSVRRAQALTADSLGAALPGSWRVRALPVSGSRVLLPAWSVCAVEGK